MPESRFDHWVVHEVISFFLVQFKHDLFYFIKHFMNACILHFDLYLLPTFGQEIDSTLIQFLILAGKKLLQVVFDVLIWAEGSTIQKILQRSEQVIVRRCQEYGGCGSTCHSSCNSFWRVIKLVWGLALCCWNTTPFLLTNSGLFSLSASLYLSSWLQ